MGAAEHEAVHAPESVRSAFDAALVQVLGAIAIPHAVFDTVEQTLILANPAFLAEFGTAPASRSSFEERFEPVQTASIDAPSRSLDGERREVFCRHTGRWYVFRWVRIATPDGTRLVLLSAQNLTERVNDIRQQRALQEQLLSSSRLMSVGEMATTLAHEINQPLATIVNCLTAAQTLLERRGGNLQRLREALDLAREQAGQAAAVVARIREFVRTREPRCECLDLRTVVDRVIDLQQMDAQKSRVRVRVALEPDLPKVRIDRVMIEQVLTNLVRNGIEAMHATHPGERTLTISARSDSEGRVEVRVADRGAGISATDEAQLFTPFFTTKPNGMGIGLAICRSIIEFHEGHLYYERATTGGSTFVFTLPREPA
jgi:C4-dicarboxylate-specific signal transduction histidine kinase